MAAKITGKFEIDNSSFRFTAIAFGRIGGQNVGVKISKTTEKALEKLGFCCRRCDYDDTKKFVTRGSYSTRGIKKRIFC